MFRRDNHVRCAEKGIGPRGVDGNRIVFAAVDFKVNFSTFAFSYPVSLHSLDGFRPIQTVQVLQKAFGVCGDFKNPLAYRFARNGRSAALAFAVFYFFVCKPR